MGLTREEIEKQGWMGDQREQVNALLDRAERAEARQITLSNALAKLRDRAVQIIYFARFHENGQANSDAHSCYGREMFELARVP